MTDIFTPDFAPFTIALMMLALIAAIELLGLAFGVAFSGLVDGLLPEVDVYAETGGAGAAGGDVLGDLLAWLHVGKVPVLIIFAAFLAGFGLSGIALQNASTAIFGGGAPLFLAAPAAFLLALPATRMLAGAAVRIMPQDETDAVSEASFVGRIALIIRGEAVKGRAAEAKLIDARGLTQYVLIEPADEGVTFREGEEAVIVESAGAVVRGVPCDLKGRTDPASGE